MFKLPPVEIEAKRIVKTQQEVKYFSMALNV